MTMWAVRRLTASLVVCWWWWFWTSSEGVHACKGPGAVDWHTTPRTPRPTPVTIDYDKLNDYTLVDSETSCERVSPDSNKTWLYCYNNGKCASTTVPLNKTHVEKVVYCECAECWYGYNCREDICSPAMIEANVGYIILCILVVFLLVISIVGVIKCRSNADSKNKNNNKADDSELANELGNASEKLADHRLKRAENRQKQ